MIPTARIPLRRLALTALACDLAGILAGLAACSLAGAGSSTLLATGIALMVLGGVGLAPVLLSSLVPADRWGLLVLGASVARTLLAIAAVLTLVEIGGFARRPVVLGVLSGALVMLVLEAITAVRNLNRPASSSPSV